MIEHVDRIAGGRGRRADDAGVLEAAQHRLQPARGQLGERAQLLEAGRAARQRGDLGDRALRRAQPIEAAAARRGAGPRRRPRRARGRSARRGTGCRRRARPRPRSARPVRGARARAITRSSSRSVIAGRSITSAASPSSSSSARCAGAARLGGPRRDHGQRAGDLRDEQAEQLEAIVVGPLQVIDHDDAVRRGHQGPHHLDEGEQGALALDPEIRGGLVPAHRIDQRRQHGKHAPERGGVLDLLREPRIARELGGEIVDDRVERAIGNALALVAAPAPRDDLAAARATDGLVDQASSCRRPTVR